MTDFLSRLWPLALLSLGLGVTILLFYLFSRHVSRHGRSRFAPAYYPLMLPCLFLFYLLLFLFSELLNSKHVYLTQLFRLLAAAVVYFSLLRALTPLLRKRISAQGCAALWLLPNLLFYFSTYLLHGDSLVEPLFVVWIPRSALWTALGVCSVGFVTVLAGNFFSHLRFRQAVLQDAVPVSAQERDLFLSTWRALCFNGNVRPPGFKANMKAGGKLTVLRSPAVDSPLTVGLLEKKRCLILPQRDYSEGELWLIFRHEGIHLLHQDNWLKLTLAFLCAAGWFIPTLWSGMRKASEDLELCCDELVTEGIAEDRRRDYSDLLLTNAGTTRGFTTCLSASASGLRYRMARILHPQKRRAGFLAVLLLSVVFYFLYGMVGVTAVGGTVQTKFLDRDGGWEVMEVRPNYKEHKFQEEYCDDPAVCARVEVAIANLELAAPADRLNYGIYPYLWVKLRHGDDVIIVSLGNWALSAHNCTTDQVQFYEYCELHTEEIRQIRDLIPYIPED
jgi:beta-lactamase regulating signal transducer with metallopeptidase domain